MGPTWLLHPMGERGNPVVVLKHKHCQDMTTSKPGILNSEPRNQNIKSIAIKTR